MLLLLFWLAGAAFPSLRTWGFSLAAYVPPYFAAMSFVLCLLALLPAVGTRVGSSLEAVAARFVGKKKNSVTRALAVAVVAGPIFYFLAIPFSFLGDSFLYIAEVIRAADSGQVEFFRYNSLLSSFIFLSVGSGLMTLLGIVEVARVFWLLTAVCGAIFVYVLIRGVNSVADDAIDAVIFIGLILGLGGVILFGSSPFVVG